MTAFSKAPVHLLLLLALAVGVALAFWTKADWTIFPAIALVPVAVSLARKLGFEPADDPAAQKERKVH